MINFLLYVWQLPQNLVGLIVVLFNIRNAKFESDHVCVKHLNDCGISLGKRIILDQDSRHSATVIKHEQGHQKQSRIFGPLYLLIIGLPSAMGNLYDRLAHKNWVHIRRMQWYYSQPWEKQADKFGKVERNYSLC